MIGRDIALKLFYFFLEQMRLVERDYNLLFLRSGKNAGNIHLH